MWPMDHLLRNCLVYFSKTFVNNRRYKYCFIIHFRCSVISNVLFKKWKKFWFGDLGKDLSNYTLIYYSPFLKHKNIIFFFACRFDGLKDVFKTTLLQRFCLMTYKTDILDAFLTFCKSNFLKKTYPVLRKYIKVKRFACPLVF